MSIVKLAAPKWFKALAKDSSIFKNKNAESYFAEHIKNTPGARLWADKYLLKNDPRALKIDAKKFQFLAKNPTELESIKQIFKKYNVRGIKQWD